jgi:hypothetical protein
MAAHSDDPCVARLLLQYRLRGRPRPQIPGVTADEALATRDQDFGHVWLTPP